MNADLPRRRDPGVPESAFAAASERTRLAHDLWEMAARRSASGMAARAALIRVILTEATPLIKQSAFRLDETDEIRAVLCQAIADAVTHRTVDPFLISCVDCTDSDPCEDHAGDITRAGSYLAVAAVLGLVIEP